MSYLDWTTEADSDNGDDIAEWAWSLGYKDGVSWAKREQEKAAAAVNTNGPCFCEKHEGTLWPHSVGGAECPGPGIWLPDHEAVVLLGSLQAHGVIGSYPELSTTEGETQT